MIFDVRKLESRTNVWHYLRDPTFSRFDTIRSVIGTHRRTDGHTTTAYTALSIESRGINQYRILTVDKDANDMVNV